MIKDNVLDLTNIVEQFKGKRVFVLGDVTLDKFTEGQVTKISPEAPVPLVDIFSESYRLGAAANVMNNINALGGDVFLTTVVGDDPEGIHLRRLLTKVGSDTNGIINVEARNTTVVNRVRVDDQQLLRLDRSGNDPLDSKVSSRILTYLDKIIKDMDVILIADYGRGVISQEIVSAVTKNAKNHGKKIVVNPKKENFHYYRGVDVIRTNKREAKYVTGIELINETSMRIMGQKIISSLDCNSVLITWVEEGIHLFQNDNEFSFLPPLVNRAVDVTGVGDVITCALALSLATGANFETAAKISNYAGAIASSKQGLSAVSQKELKESIIRGLS